MLSKQNQASFLLRYDSFGKCDNLIQIQRSHRTTSHRIAPRRIASHHVASHHITSYRIVSYRNKLSLHTLFVFYFSICQVENFQNLTSEETISKFSREVSFSMEKVYMFFKFVYFIFHISDIQGGPTFRYFASFTYLLYLFI